MLVYIQLLKGDFMGNMKIQYLARKMINGDVDAKNEIIEYYTKYIDNLIETRLADFDCDKNYIRKKLLDRLFRFVDNWNSSKRPYFSEYFSNNIMQFINSEIKKQKYESKSKEIQKLAVEMINGNEDAINYVVNYYINYYIINLVEKQYDVNKEDKEDLIQSGIIGLLKAINNYSSTKNVPFATTVHGYILFEIKKEYERLNLNKEYFDSNDNINFEFISDIEDIHDIKIAISKLSKIKKEIIYLHIYQNYSFTEISSIYGFSRQRAQECYKSAIESIKQKLNLSTEKRKKL